MRTMRGAIMPGMRPLVANRVPAEMLAGLTLAAVGIPEVLGYARIAGMPVVTGLYTMVLPMLVFAVLGSSRHLVVGADSATAAIGAAGIGGLAALGSDRYVELFGLLALLTGGVLLLARLARLGLLANFLSRTVLIGFLTGVGASVAIGQLPELLGVQVRGRGSLATLAGTVRALPHASAVTVTVAAASVIVVLGVRRLRALNLRLLGIGRLRVPGALLVVVVAIAVDYQWPLAAHGVRLIGVVPGGLPGLRLPGLRAHDASALLLTAVSTAVVVLAQSAATARAYAARFGDSLDDNADLLALGLANGAAALTGSFVVNGSPTRTAVVAGAGGRSQLAQLGCCGVVVLVLLVATGPLQHLPLPVLAAVVFLIGVELIDLAGLASVARVRRSEFVVAVLTAVAVVAVGVEQAIALAIVASIIDHLRRGYDPHTQVLKREPGGHWRVVSPDPEQRTRPGLVIYRFPSSMYYANAHKLAADLAGFADSSAPLIEFCLDCTGVSDIDFTAADALRRSMARLARRGTRFVIATGDSSLRSQLDRYGLLSTAECLPTAGAVLDAYRDAAPGPGGTDGTSRRPGESD